MSVEDVMEDDALYSVLADLDIQHYLLEPECAVEKMQPEKPKAEWI